MDRRNSSRFNIGQEIHVNITNSEIKNSIHGTISDISRGGISLKGNSSIPIGKNISLQIDIPIMSQTIQVIGTVMWERTKSKAEFNHGIHILEGISNREHYFQFIEALSKLKQPLDRRSITLKNHEYPLKNRISDYKSLSYESPYLGFLYDLRQYVLNNEIDTFVISDSLLYLKKRIRKTIGDNPRIILASEMKPVNYGHITIITNMDCRRRHESFTFLDFEEFLIKTKGVRDPLITLNMVNENIKEGEPVTIFSLGEVKDYKLATKYLNIARFIDHRWDGKRSVRVTKRSLLNKELFNKSVILRETQNRNDIQRLQEFSSKYYSAGFNFSKDIDGVFNEYSHFYIVEKKETGDIVTGARVTFQLPNLFLPSMLAVKEGSEDHIQLQNPDDLSYAEIYAPYFNSYTAIKTYGELIRRFIYYTEEKYVDVFLTTHNYDKNEEAKFLSKYLGFKETNVVLKYGDFGGLWNLIYLTQENLDKNIQLKFLSPKDSPRFVNTFRHH